MFEFIQLTLASSVFWTAISALATLLAVLVAVFLPFYQKKRDANNRLIAVKIEYERNINLIKQLVQQQPFKTDDGEIPAHKLNVAMAKNLSLKIWESHWAELSLEHPEAFKELEGQNLRIADIVCKAHSAQPVEHLLIEHLAQDVIKDHGKIILDR